MSSQDEEGVASSDLSDDETESRPKDPNAITAEEEEEFNRELAKMMASTGETRKTAERKLDMTVPFVRRERARTFENEEGGDADESVQEGAKGLRFMLLTKKGSKQQVSRHIPLVQSCVLPSDG